MASKNVNLIIIVLVIVVIDVIGGYFIGKKVLVPATYDRDMSEESTDGPEFEEGEGASEEPGTIHPLEPINLNPAISMGEVFSCSLSLVTQDPELVIELDMRNDQIVDIILNYLAAKTVVELNDVTMRDEYRTDITEKINAILTTGRITNLFITQWILQL